MKTSPISALTAIALLGASPAFAEEVGSSGQPAEATPAPSIPAPTQLPPAPAANPGLPPGVAPGSAPAAPQAAGPQPTTGQWSYTSQYGWVYLPYAQSYTYVAPDGGIAYTYAYYPARGWVWVEAPWVLGWGPRPFWGFYGYGHFAWYAHPWFHAGVYHGAYAYRGGHPGGFGHAWGRGGWHGGRGHR